MKQLIILFTTMAMAMNVNAQNQNPSNGDSLKTVQKSVEMEEITIEQARIIAKPDGKLIIPSTAQRESATNGYSLLSKLALPRIRVDNVLHTITAIGSNGSVQLRINGTIASKEDLLTLDPKLVKNIDFIDNPGVRYGQDIGYVINIRTTRKDSGGVIGADLSNSLSAVNGNNAAYGKLNHKDSEFALTYNFGYQDFKGNDYNEKADYLLNDNSHYRVERTTISNRARYFNNSLQMKYNLADSANYVFQAAFSTDLNNSPGDDALRLLTEGQTKQLTNQWESERSFTPVLDLYFYHRLGKRQSITANAVGTSIATKGKVFQDEGVPYRFAVDGRTWSLHTEAIYENQLKPFTLSLGLQHDIKYTRNEYSGDVNSLNQMHNQQYYLFGEAKGSWEKLSYVAGLGVTNIRYRQAQDRYNYWLFRPKFSLGYSLSPSLNLRYTFEINEHLSKIAMISNTRIRENSREWRVGNPNIEPNKVVNHTLSLELYKPRLTNMLSIHYRNNSNPNMSHYERTPDNQFLYSQLNQKRIEMFYAGNYFRYDLIPEKLVCSTNIMLFRFLNKGFDYKHHLTAYNLSASIEAYLGKWSVSAYADNGWKFVEGETMSHQAAAIYVGAGYRTGNLTLSLYWQNPLMAHPQMQHTNILNRYVSKNIRMRGSNYGNLINFNVSWKLEYGRKYKVIDRRLNHRDTQTGIMKSN